MTLDRYLEHLDHGGNNSDKRDEPQKRKVGIKSEPAQSTRPKEIREDQIVERHRYGEHEKHRATHAKRCFHALGGCKKHAQPEEKRQPNAMFSTRAALTKRLAASIIAPLPALAPHIPVAQLVRSSTYGCPRLATLSGRRRSAARASVQKAGTSRPQPL